jgi:hypothetical protein
MEFRTEMSGEKMIAGIEETTPLATPLYIRIEIRLVLTSLTSVDFAGSEKRP